MNKFSRTLICAALLSAGPAMAQFSDAFCLGNCEMPAATQEAPATTTLELCQHRVVREALGVERKLKPAKEIVDAVQNPAGFALKLVDKHVIHIPAWVGYAMNPQGAIRAKVIDRVRQEVKKSAGIDKGCVPQEADSDAQAPSEPAVESGILPQPEEA
jgi:hypothetical protein